MIPLHARGHSRNVETLTVGVVTSGSSRTGGIFLAESADALADAVEQRSRVILTTIEEPTVAGLADTTPVICGIPSLSHLEDGDIVAVHPRGRVDTLFRVSSEDNALFVTDRCNSNCLMCSQPPKDIDDIDYHFAMNAALIPLIPRATKALGMTGGEPTLLGGRLLQLFSLLATHLPDTEVHVLTNGRAFAWQNVVRSVSAVATERVMFAIPLYSDFADQHDFVVQARNAFAQTVLGLHNLARYDQRVEIRVVLHRQTHERLPQLARFIHKNLPFVEHIAFMGLEYTGYTPHNDTLLWIDPPAYADRLSEAVEYLAAFRYSVSLYNLQLCLLPEHLWPYCRSSISDWKREYLSECMSCSARTACGGVFGTSGRQTELIKAL